MAKDFASDYIDVATRIVEFRDKYPNGSLQPADIGQPFTMIEVDGARFIVVVAAAYRTADDTRPGIGMAQEQIPGRTPYTRGSELQNAETSAWGRAIVAALAADTKKGIASADEVRNRQAEDAIDISAPKRAQRRNARDIGDPATTPDEFAAPPQRVTDLEWMDGFEKRITAAGSQGELNGLVDEARQVFREGRLTDADALLLKEATDARLAELGVPA